MKELYEKLTFTKYGKNAICFTCKGTGVMQPPYQKEECLSCDGSGKEYDYLKAGDVIKLKDGEMKLIGDLNRSLGTCDDCTYCDPEEIIETANIFQLLSKQSDLSKQELSVIAALMEFAIEGLNKDGCGDLELLPDIIDLMPIDEWYKINSSGTQVMPKDIPVMKHFAKRLKDLADK